MTGEARRTIKTVQECLAEDRYYLTAHFQQRMEQRGLFWPDVEAVIGEPKDVQSQGMDTHNRPKWTISGEAADGEDIEIVCAVETDDTQTTFITLYWED
jgi:hypothetical protein